LELQTSILDSKESNIYVLIFSFLVPRLKNYIQQKN